MITITLSYDDNLIMSDTLYFLSFADLYKVFSQNTIVLPEFRNDLKTDFKNVLNYFGFDEPFFC